MQDFDPRLAILSFPPLRLLLSNWIAAIDGDCLGSSIE